VQADVTRREVECDPEQVKQLLLNLVLNAIQATEGPGTVIVRALFVDNALRIEVYDHGQGISSEQKDHIFEPFFTTKENGTGLGLAIASNIASQHGGSLTFVANTNGTVFRFEMPSSANAIELEGKAVAL
jgi:signal transduction histidine kinase